MYVSLWHLPQGTCNWHYNMCKSLGMHMASMHLAIKSITMILHVCSFEIMKWIWDKLSDTVLHNFINSKCMLLFIAAVIQAVPHWTSMDFIGIVESTVHMYSSSRSIVLV